MVKFSTVVNLTGEKIRSGEVPLRPGLLIQCMSQGEVLWPVKSASHPSDKVTVGMLNRGDAVMYLENTTIPICGSDGVVLERLTALMVLSPLGEKAFIIITDPYGWPIRVQLQTD